MNVLDEIVADQIRTDLPELASGDTVKVSAKVVEGGKERIQVFEGTVMRLRGGGITRSITVRKIASGVGVERTFMINSPRIEKIEVVRHGRRPARPAVLPAQAGRQGRDPARAPPGLVGRVDPGAGPPRGRLSTLARSRPRLTGRPRIGLPLARCAIVPTLRFERSHWRAGAVPHRRRRRGRRGPDLRRRSSRRR